MAKKFNMNWGAITEKIKEAEKGGTNFKDDRIYTLKAGDDGSAHAVIRFLPNKDLESIPFSKVFSHGFKEHGSWFINNCPTTIGKECPVCKANTDLWDDDPDTVRTRSRKTSYYANILVIKDSQNPANEGKVFLFRYGKKIQEKIMDAIEGKFEEAVMIFDPYEGANFKLMLKTTKTGDRSYPNYDSSSFSAPSALEEDVFTEVVKQLCDVNEFITLDKFKTYEEIAERFSKVIGSSSPSASQKSSTRNEEKQETKQDDNQKDSQEATQESAPKTEVNKDAFLKKLRSGVSSNK